MVARHPKAKAWEVVHSGIEGLKGLGYEVRTALLLDPDQEQPEPRSPTWEVSYKGQAHTNLTYDEMRQAAYDFNEEAWKRAGSPLDPAWPAAAAEEHKWVEVERAVREIRLPDSTTIIVRESVQVEQPEGGELREALEELAALTDHPEWLRALNLEVPERVIEDVIAKIQHLNGIARAALSTLPDDETGEGLDSIIERVDAGTATDDDFRAIAKARGTPPQLRDRCPTCGSDDPEIHKLSSAFDSPRDYPDDKLCPDDWHSPGVDE